MTAKNAIATSAAAEPLASAAPALRRSSPERSRAWRRIHTIMNVTIPTAAAPTIVSRPSCCALRELLVGELQRHAGGDAQGDRGGDAEPHRPQRVARGPPCAGSAAMMPTISAASTPSRRPITNVGSTAPSSFELG